MNIFDNFSYEKKPSIFAIKDSSDDNDSVVCLDEVRSHQRKSFIEEEESISIIDTTEEESEVMPDSTPVKKRKQVFLQSDGDSSPVKKRKQVFLQSDGDSSEDEENIKIRQKPKRKRIQQITDSEDDDKDDPQPRSNNTSVVVIESDNGADDTLTTDNTEDEDAEDDGEIRLYRDPSLIEFVNTCTTSEMLSLPNINEQKAETILAARPYENLDQLVEIFSSVKNVSLENFLRSCKRLVKERREFENVIKKCEKISATLQKVLDLDGDIENLPVQPPACMNESLELKNYQLIGLNWLAMLNENDVNGILADQMGLGKTIQSLAFLGYLLENGHNGPHLIVCPTSTLDNWVRELEKWLPEVSYVQYKGSQVERYHLRRNIREDDSQSAIIMTTMNLLSSTKQDRNFFKQLEIQYLILDEAHMIKNVKSERYRHLSSLNVKRKLLLTGTPLQNDINELLALLAFLMPDLFKNTQNMFYKQTTTSKSDDLLYEKNQLSKMKKVLKPFILRRIKSDVLADMPKKHEEIHITMITLEQRSIYDGLLETYKNSRPLDRSKLGLLMNLRKTANHPLLLRNLYTDTKLTEMSKKYCGNPDHFDCDANIVFEDMQVMSDYELHSLCSKDIYLKPYKLDEKVIFDCGKMKYLDELLPKLLKNGDRVLLFSQFVLILNILETYVKNRGYKFVRFDGSTKGSDRQQIIDDYNNNDDIFIFLLSTKAGGLGINLTSANVVVLHDLDFNPYNDKQAEDRCHRVGQKRDVTIHKLVSENTVEEYILKCGEMKLNLEKQLVNTDGNEDTNDDTRQGVLKMLEDTI